jgi:O-antigen ligase
MSISPGATLTALGLFVAFAVLMLGVARMASSVGARKFAAVIATIAAMVAVVGIVQKPLYTGRIYGFWAPLMGGVPFGPFVNPNHFAGWMVMALPVTFGLLCAVVARGSSRMGSGWRGRMMALSSRHANQVMLLGGAAIVMSLSLVLTMSRSGIVAFFTSVALTSWFAVRRLGGGSTRLAVAAYLVAAVLLSVATVGAETIAARFGTANPATINNRLPIWRDTSAIVRDFWLTGTGVNTYGVATLFYQTAEPDFHLREAHNDYLQLAAEGGLLVTIPVACALVAFAVQVRRRFRGSRGSSYWIRLGAVNGLVAIALQSTVDFSLQMPGNAALFAVLAGLALHHDPPRSLRHRAVVVRDDHGVG